MIAALAFVPISDVVHAFERLTIELPSALAPVRDYFEEYYIGSLNYRSGRRKSPIFPLEFSNVYDRVLKDQARTNNNMEAYHRV